MNPHWLLLPVAALCGWGAWLSYSDQGRRSPHFVPTMVILGAACAALFALGVRKMDDKLDVYVFSLVYDCVVLATYYVLPLLVLGVRPNWCIFAGSALVVFGLVMVKCGGGS